MFMKSYHPSGCFASYTNRCTTFEKSCETTNRLTEVDGSLIPTFQKLKQIIVLEKETELLNI